MKVPRDLSGEKVAKLLARHYGYRVTRTKGSHMTVTRTNADAKQHSVTVPRQPSVVGRPRAIEQLGEDLQRVTQRATVKHEDQAQGIAGIARAG